MTFLALRQREPHLTRPFKVRYGKLVGGLAVVLSIGMIGLYMPGSPSALLPVEWLVFGAWMAVGLAMYGWSRNRYGVAHADQAMQRELAGEDVERPAS